ncbi:MAG: NUDIX domain-containing protein [Mollicutes bacterium]|jgi:8-oxo-dGTP diphosphatase|nr:NUDIX domain-containing protein [Mollicutes bacterium]
MERKIVLTGIIKCKELFLVVQRNKNDDFYPSAWEFPGGNLEDGELLCDALKRELKEEINFTKVFEAKIINYYDEIKEKNNELYHIVELDFLIDVDNMDLDIKLSLEHSNYKWVKKDSELLDNFIKNKIKNL